MSASHLSTMFLCEAIAFRTLELSRLLEEDLIRLATKTENSPETGKRIEVTDGLTLHLIGMMFDMSDGSRKEKRW